MFRRLFEAIKEGRVEDFIKKNYDGLLQQTAMAYADLIAVDQFDNPGEGMNLRDLHWDGEFTDAETFRKQAEIIGAYNEFDTDVARTIVKYFGDTAKYRLGREYSVVVYVQTSKEFDPEHISLFKADEYDKQEDGTIRIWWD